MAKAHPFELEIVRPTTSELFEVTYISVQAVTGNFIVGHDHRPLVAILKQKGDLLFQQVNGEETLIDIFGGLFIVKDGKAICILES